MKQQILIFHKPTAINSVILCFFYYSYNFPVYNMLQINSLTQIIYTVALSKRKNVAIRKFCGGI